MAQMLKDTNSKVFKLECYVKQCNIGTDICGI